ncbi:MAG: FHA domain-containing protein, partial [Planctomycetota bacterium]
MTRLIVTQAGREKSFDLIDDVIFLGRGEDCAIRIDGEGVDERHCQVLKVDGRYRVLNLGTSGTRVNGQSITQHELSNGDVIQIGAVAIAYRGGVVPDAAAAPAAEPAPAAAAPPASGSGYRPRRRGARGGRSGKEIRVPGSMQQAASQREVLTRQRVRKSGLSGPATIGIASLV